MPLIYLIMAGGGHGSYYGIAVLGSWFALPWIYFKGFIFFFILPVLGPALYWLLANSIFGKTISFSLFMGIVYLAGSTVAALSYAGNDYIAGIPEWVFLVVSIIVILGFLAGNYIAQFKDKIGWS